MTGRRLSPLDASFLAVETPTAHMHVGFAAVFEPPERGPAPSYGELLEHVGARLGRAPRFRQKLCPVPFGVSAPVWVDDGDFHLSRHIRRSRQTSLAEVVEATMSEPLPRDRPLWEIRIAERLDDGRIGLVGRAHHCMADGIATVELGSLLLDSVPDPTPPPQEEWRPVPTPGRLELLGSGIADLARQELELAALPARLLGTPGRAFRMVGRANRALVALADSIRPAPRSEALNAPISPLRTIGLTERPIDDLIRIKNGFGVKLNDVLLGASAGAVRRFLQERGDRPIRLKAMVPVNVRDAGDRGELGNRISFMFVDLPCDEPDPVRRLCKISGATAERKERGDPEGSDDVLRTLGLTPGPLQRVIARVVASPRAFNLVVSNIPGPQEPLYMRGCRLVEAYPVVPIADQHALSIGFTTICDRACFGLYADRRSLPDVDRLATDLDAALDELVALGAERQPRATRVPAGSP